MDSPKVMLLNPLLAPDEHPPLKVSGKEFRHPSPSSVDEPSGQEVVGDNDNDGCTEGKSDGDNDNDTEGKSDGDNDNDNDGCTEGKSDGDNDNDGCSDLLVGVAEGLEVLGPSSSSSQT